MPGVFRPFSLVGQKLNFRSTFNSDLLVFQRRIVSQRFENALFQSFEKKMQNVFDSSRMRQNADFDFWNSMNAIELGPENNQKWDLVTQMSQIVTNWG